MKETLYRTYLRHDTHKVSESGSDTSQNASRLKGTYPKEVHEGHEHEDISRQDGCVVAQRQRYGAKLTLHENQMTLTTVHVSATNSILKD